MMLLAGAGFPEAGLNLIEKDVQSVWFLLCARSFQVTRAKIRGCLAAWLCSVSFWEYLFEANKPPTIPIYQGVDELNELS